MDLELADKVAVVTGASKGIGLAVVRELAAEGATVVAGARHVDALETIEGVRAVAVDLADPDGPECLVGHAVVHLGRVDVLVNHVGAAHVRLDGFLSLTDADFHASLQLNFFAALRATRAAVRDLATRKKARSSTSPRSTRSSSRMEESSTTVPPRQRSSTSRSPCPRSSGRAGFV